MNKQDKLNDQMVQGLKSLFPDLKKLEDQQKVIDFRLTQTKDVLTGQITDLERKAQGTTRANSEVAQLRKEIARLSNKLAETEELCMELEKVSAKFAGGSVNDDILPQLKRLDRASTGLYLQVARVEERVRLVENSPALNIDFPESKIKVAHKSEIDTVTPWGQAFAWGGVGCILGLLLFGVMANVENAWIGVLSFALIGLFVSAFVLTKLNLKLQIEAQHDWAKKQPPVVVVNEDIEEPTSQWWASDQAQVE